MLRVKLVEQDHQVNYANGSPLADQSHSSSPNSLYEELGDFLFLVLWHHEEISTQRFYYPYPERRTAEMKRNWT